MTKRLTYFLLACTVMLAVSPAWADTLRIVTVSLPPYGYTDKGKDTGLSYELCNLIAHQAGFESENRIVPLSRAMEDIATNKADMILMLTNPKISTCATHLGQLLDVETIILGRADSRYRSLKDVRGKTVATVRDAKYDARISKENGFILYPTTNYSQSLKMLLAKRVDAIIGPKLGLYYTARMNNYPRQAFGDPLILSTTKASIFISDKTTDNVSKRISAAMTKIRNNGSAHRLMEEYASQLR
ncbi:MAG: transporter substrate-binding domain-containing protein [Pseudodesulfovibrio sp.]|nr:transporter substrate-binding domain-containing protein [Pseudodesulfovibrio sp.]